MVKVMLEEDSDEVKLIYLRLTDAMRAMQEAAKPPYKKVVLLQPGPGPRGGLGY